MCVFILSAALRPYWTRDAWANLSTSFDLRQPTKVQCDQIAINLCCILCFQESFSTLLPQSSGNWLCQQLMLSTRFLDRSVFWTAMVTFIAPSVRKKPAPSRSSISNCRSSILSTITRWRGLRKIQSLVSFESHLPNADTIPEFRKCAFWSNQIGPSLAFMSS